MSSDSSLENIFAVIRCLVFLSVYRLFGVCGQYFAVDFVFVGIFCSCSVCAVLLHLFSVARVPLAALFFSLLLVFLLGGRPGRGFSSCSSSFLVR